MLTTWPSAFHYLWEEDTKHYAMLNHKMSLSLLCGEAQSEYKLGTEEINSSNSTKATTLSLINFALKKGGFPKTLFEKGFQKSPKKHNEEDCICSSR